MFLCKRACLVFEYGKCFNASISYVRNFSRQVRQRNCKYSKVNLRYIKAHFWCHKSLIQFWSLLKSLQAYMRFIWILLISVRSYSRQGILISEFMTALKHKLHCPLANSISNRPTFSSSDSPFYCLTTCVNFSNITNIFKANINFRIFATIKETFRSPLSPFISI